MIVKVSNEDCIGCFQLLLVVLFGVRFAGRSPAPPLELLQAAAVAREGQLSSLQMRKGAEGGHHLQSPDAFSSELLECVHAEGGQGGDSGL